MTTVVLDVMLFLAVLANTYAFWRHDRARRRLLRSHDEFTKQHLDEIARLIAFAAFMSREEVGAPEKIREMARGALPKDVSVEMTVMPANAKVH